MNSPLVVGFLASFALIAAIGAQNAFVLRQGIRREHVLPVVAMCTVSDIVLIAAGIARLRRVGQRPPGAIERRQVRRGGVPLGYGYLRPHGAYRPVGVDPVRGRPRATGRGPGDLCRA